MGAGPGAGIGEAGPDQGPITGIHDVRIPVVEPWVSRDWYVSVLGFQPVLDLQEAEGLVGVVLRHPTGFVVGLHQDPERARALAS